MVADGMSSTEFVGTLVMGGNFTGTVGALVDRPLGAAIGIVVGMGCAVVFGMGALLVTTTGLSVRLTGTPVEIVIGFEDGDLTF